jgi:uncharacterized protein (TIGR02246 family)
MDDARIDQLERRLQALEDEREIQRVLVRYGLAVDVGDAEATMALYAPDCFLDLNEAVFMQGREQTRGIVESDVHQALLPNCAHVMGPFVVQVDGDHAVATGYATVFLKQDGVSRIWHQAFGRWELSRCDGQWLITKRTSRTIGRPDNHPLIEPALR